MLCFEVRSSCQCTDSPPNDRSHTCYKFEIWNLGHIMTYHSSFTLGSNPDELLLDSLNSTSVLHHPFLYNDRDVMKVGSRTGSCLSASCGMCYPPLYRWTQQVELRNEENTCRYHWLVQRESHSEQFHNPCFTNQYPLCTPTPSIPFYVTLFFHYILIWGKIPLMISNDEPAAHKEWFNDKSTHLFGFFWWRISVKRWRCLLSFWVSMQIPKPIKHIGYKKQIFGNCYCKENETQHIDIEVIQHDVGNLQVWPWPLDTLNHVIWEVTPTCHVGLTRYIQYRPYNIP